MRVKIKTFRDILNNVNDQNLDTMLEAMEVILTAYVNNVTKKRMLTDDYKSKNTKIIDIDFVEFEADDPDFYYEEN